MQPQYQQVPQQQMQMVQMDYPKKGEGYQGPQNPYSQMNGLQKLANVFGVFVKMVPQYCREFCGIDCEKQYDIYATNENGYENAMMLFKVSLENSCCDRMCCFAQCREFKMEIKHANADGFNNGVLSFKSEREGVCFSAPCYPISTCARKDVKIFYEEGQHKAYLGKFTHPCTCCSCQNNVLEVHDANDQKLATVGLYPCQCGTCFPLYCCQSCQTVTFDVFNSNEQQVSTLVKESAGCCRLYKDMEKNVRTQFTPEQSPEVRAMLMVAMVYVDYLNFNVESIKRIGDISLWSGLWSLCL